MQVKKLENINELETMSRQIRRDIINMLLISKSGHTGAPLGLADIFTALYFNILNIDAEDPSFSGRDFLFVSIGHVAPVWYAALARRGYFPLDELKTLRKINSRLQGHPAPQKIHGVPGVEIASGSLGQGLSVAVGTALGLRLDKKENVVFCINGDGEIQEGQIWEAAMTAAHHKLDNLIMVIDSNDCQIDGRVHNVMNVKPIDEKFKAFGWDVFEMNGNNMEEVLAVINLAKKAKGKPKVIIANTLMGFGVSFMQDDYKWHGVPPNEEQGLKALAELQPTGYGDFI